MSNGYYIETNNEKDMKYLYISTIELKKNVYWRNYQHSLMVCTTRIVQLKWCHGKLEVYESKWMPCFSWSVGWFLLHIY